MLLEGFHVLGPSRTSWKIVIKLRHFSNLSWDEVDGLHIRCGGSHPWGGEFILSKQQKQNIFNVSAWGPQAETTSRMRSTTSNIFQINQISLSSIYTLKTASDRKMEIALTKDNRLNFKKLYSEFSKLNF